ncbi:MAG: mannose-6-phosphate isomerase, class I [Ilumatobacter sp.]|uniref:mannose-6-phosphate isomerase, class I n=1 Tax=Ilumatobacter sp. TaxID=1967498 RepID=UPI0026291B52|nr:mannose-6-phosphate isomerase, class I [Ilumatobacter sp.]MDJ0768603.1 mannose-6-phosphate isomerase, class I [Ilumatobacter sp.]
MQRVEGVVQHYAWGDPAFIPDLLGLEPDGRPWAELWLGTHPNGPSRLDDGTPLEDRTGPLPYLLKVLAAAEPLSLQTHPTVDQARDGHARGIFPDPNPKPELLCALTPFQALCGVRPVEATLDLLHDLGIEQLADVLAADGPARALNGLYRGAIDARPAIEACRTGDRPEAEWVRKLDVRYPGEPSVAATLLLNLVVLEPGQALRLDAGNLHAYLHGAGIELMGASDNVVRGGLTVKPVDVDELLRTVDATPLDTPVLADGARYELPAAGVALVRLAPGEPHTATTHELAIELTGTTWYCEPGDVFVPDEITYVVTDSNP